MLDHLIGRTGGLAGQQPALLVEPFELGGQLAGADGVAGGQQFDRHGGIFQAPECVHARAELEADRVGRQGGGVDARDIHQRQQPHPAGGAQLGEAPLQEIAGVVHLLGDVGHDAQRHQVEQIFLFAAAAGKGIQLLHQLKGDADAGQRAQRIARGQELWIDDGIGPAHALRARRFRRQAPQRIHARRQALELGGQVVMVGDDDREPAILGQADGRPFGNAGVAAEEHLDGRAVGLGRVKLLAQRFDLDAVAFFKAVGDVKLHGLVAGQRPQRRHQQRGAGLAVDVEVAPDQEARLGGDGGVELRRGLGNAQQGGGRRRRVLLRVEEGEGLGGRIDPALGQQAGDQGAPAGDCQQFR